MSPKGFLTENDKQFLRGEKEYEDDQARYQKRYRLRNRVREAILDFKFLETSTESELRNIRSNIFKENDNAITSGVKFLLSFVYYGLRDQGNDLEVIEYIFEEAIQQAERIRGAEHSELGPVRSVSVELSIDRAPTHEIGMLKKQFEEREPLTDSQLMALVRAGEITTEEIQEYEEDQIVEY